MGERRDNSIADSAAPWLDVALETAKCAVFLSERNPPMKRQALFMVQQSAETATKAIALMAGFSYETVVKSRHDNLNLACRVIQQIARATGLDPFLDSIMPKDQAAESLMSLGGILRATSRQWEVHYAEMDEFRQSMQLASHSEVKAVLDALDNVDAMLEESVAPPVGGLVAEILASLDISDIDENDIETAIARITESSGGWMARNGLSEDAISALGHFLTSPPIVKALSEFSALAEEDSCAIAPNAAIEKNVASNIASVWAIVKVFVIGGLAWPHQASARYPAPPGAPDSLKDAVRRDMLGAKHYTDEIGVVRYVQELSASIMGAVETIKSRHKSSVIPAALEAYRHDVKSGKRKGFAVKPVKGGFAPGVDPMNPKAMLTQLDDDLYFAKDGKTVST